ncbi:AT-rich interactive domain-containing protein 5B-like [Hetaerina americana]|uniref:AT-rich interactive domain-containing protein 5B-like n=1 Tax=Hetaerina americana TaxID=62018 RepID=UPI003A7F1FCA
MDNNKIQLVGAPCGHHGPYTFYKAFKYCKNGKFKILALSEFFFVKIWSDSDLVSIGELQLLWEDKNSDQVLSSLRLYFLPENTPEGRSDDHGEDEVLAISEKVVLRVEDLLTWITEDATWTRGLQPSVWDSGVTPDESALPNDPTASSEAEDAPKPESEAPDPSAPTVPSISTEDPSNPIPPASTDPACQSPSAKAEPTTSPTASTTLPSAPEATAVSNSSVELISLPTRENHLNSTLDFRDVIREKQKLLQQQMEIKQEGDDGSEDGSKVKLEDGGVQKIGKKHQGSVVILSYARYCRFRAVLKRLEGLPTPREGVPSPGWLRGVLAVALGGFPVSEPDTHVLFCKDTFDYPDLEGHELLCNHLAPNLKGRRRRKRKKRSPSPESESNESESSLSTYSSAAKNKFGVGSSPGTSVNNRDGIRSGRRLVPPPRGRRRRPGGSAVPPLPPGPQRPPSSSSASSSPPPHNHTNPSSPDTVVRTEEERRFLSHLHTFMKHRGSPIERLPHLGFKKIDLYEFYGKVQSSGGYEKVTGRKLWKHIYDELGGHQGNTSAATCTRRHYERLLLPYERKQRGQEDKPPPAMHRRHGKVPGGSGDVDAGDTSNEGSSSTEGPPPSRGHRKLESENGDGRDQHRRPSSVHGSSGRSYLGEESGISVVGSVMVTSPGMNSGGAATVPRDKESIVPRPNGGLRLEGRDGAVPPPPELVPLPKTGHAALRDLARRASPAGLTVPSSHPYPISMPTRTASYAAATSLKIPVVPSLKRRKLEILREGGLEVTPIPAPAFPPPPTSVSRSSTGRPSVIHHASPPSPHVPIRDGINMPSSQISITVTPDLNHIIGNSDSMMRGVGSALHAGQRISQESGPSPTGLPRVTQSRSIYARSETVYGNPQEGLHLPQRTCLPVNPGPSGIEVLDLRTKARPGSPQNMTTTVVSDDDDVVEIDRVCGPDPARSSDVRRRRPRGVGSGLEITIVEGNDNHSESRGARRPTPGRRKSDEVPNGAHAGLVVPIPGRSGGGGAIHGIHASSPLFVNYPSLSGSRPPSSESATPHPSLYVPILDPAAFCSALYGGGSGIQTSSSLPIPTSIHRSHFASSHLNPQVSLPSSSSQLRPSASVTQRQMQMYKEVFVGGGMNGIVPSLSAAGFGSRSVAGLGGDGSASVTPILAHLTPHPRATPTSK